MEKEWEVGEIGNINGHWYQCINGDYCHECDLRIYKCTKHKCIPGERKDGKGVVFKRLKEIGEPYAPINNEHLLIQQYQAYVPVTKINSHIRVHTHGIGNIIAVEIEQSEEGIEEKTFCEKAVKANKEYLLSKLRPFDLEAAKAGEPVCTKDGREVRIICFNKSDKDEYKLPIVALIKRYDGHEIIQLYDNDGKCRVRETDDFELMMIPKKKKGWVNVYRKGNDTDERITEEVVYKTRKEAFDKALPKGYIDTVEVFWNE